VCAHKEGGHMGPPLRPLTTPSAKNHSLQGHGIPTPEIIESLPPARHFLLVE